MDELFSIGELSHYQNISKQTLIFYDKTGLFKPAYVDPQNGYRYYSAAQLDELDTILILKKSGLSLQKSGNCWNTTPPRAAFPPCGSSSLSSTDRCGSCGISAAGWPSGATYWRKPSSTGTRQWPWRKRLCGTFSTGGAVPRLLREVSISTKQCFAEAFQRGVPIFFQSGVIVPRENI